MRDVRVRFLGEAIRSNDREFENNPQEDPASTDSMNASRHLLSDANDLGNMSKSSKQGPGSSGTDRPQPSESTRSWTTDGGYIAHLPDTRLDGIDLSTNRRFDHETSGEWLSAPRVVPVGNIERAEKEWGLSINIFGATVGGLHRYKVSPLWEAKEITALSCELARFKANNLVHEQDLSGFLRVGNDVIDASIQCVNSMVQAKRLADEVEAQRQFELSMRNKDQQCLTSKERMIRNMLGCDV